MIRLTDEEIDQEYDNILSRDPSQWDSLNVGRYLAKAQLKKVVEWGNKDCPHTEEELGILCVEETGRPELKRECDLCWQALSEEAKE